VLKAKAEYDSTKVGFNEAATRHLNDLGLNHPDGRASLAQATKVESRAFQKYRDAIMAFNAFILRGEVPDGPKPD
jgi:hypothetical protein